MKHGVVVRLCRPSASQKEKELTEIQGVSACCTDRGNPLGVLQQQEK